MFYVPADRIDEAWEGGASRLAEVCSYSDGDIAPEQLRGALKAGTKMLLGHEDGWIVVEVHQYPSRRVLHVDAIHAPGVEAFKDLEAFARHNRCDAIQGACRPSVRRLLESKYGFRPAYTVMRKDL